MIFKTPKIFKEKDNLQPTRVRNDGDFFIK